MAGDSGSPRNHVIEPALLSLPKSVEAPPHPRLETESILYGQTRAQLEQEIVEHQRTRQALRESKAEYRDLFENTSDLIQSIGVDGHFIYVNPAWYQALGYSSEAVKNITVYDIIHPDNLALCISVLQRVFAGETITNFEAILMNHIGREVMVEGSVSCLFKDGKPISTRFVLRMSPPESWLKKPCIAANSATLWPPKAPTMACGIGI
jgi:PAS domain S-box-containing protein